MEVPWFFTLVGAVVGGVGVVWCVEAVLGGLWWVLRWGGRGVLVLLEGVGVLGGGLGMREGGVPVVVVVDTEVKGRRRGRRMG